MDFYKIIALFLIMILVICIPIFIWIFIKMLYHYQRMIFNIKKEAYSKSIFVLGPLLLASDKSFNEKGVESRQQFFEYFRKALIFFSVMVSLWALVSFLRNGTIF